MSGLRKTLFKIRLWQICRRVAQEERIQESLMGGNCGNQDRSHAGCKREMSRGEGEKNIEYVSKRLFG